MLYLWLSFYYTQKKLNYLRLLLRKKRKKKGDEREESSRDRENDELGAWLRRFKTNEEIVESDYMVVELIHVKSNIATP